MKLWLYVSLMIWLFKLAGGFLQEAYAQAEPKPLAENSIKAENHPLIDNVFSEERKDGEIKPDSNYLDDNLYFWGLVLLGFTVMLLFYSNPGYYQSLWRAFFSNKSFQQLITISQQRFFLQNVILDVLFIFSIALLVFSVQQAYESLSLIKIYYLFLIAILVALVVMTISLLSLWVFYGKEILAAYTFRVISLNRVFGILLIAFLILMKMSVLSIGQVAFVSLMLFGGFLIYRFGIMVLWLSKKSRFSFLYNFIYLCTFEILIVFLIVKQYLLFFGT